jgi:hypothetical protein
VWVTVTAMPVPCRYLLSLSAARWASRTQALRPPLRLIPLTIQGRL